MLNGLILLNLTQPNPRVLLSKDLNRLIRVGSAIFNYTSDFYENEKWFKSKEALYLFIQTVYLLIILPG